MIGEYKMLNEIFDLTILKMHVVRLNDLRTDGSFLCPRCNNIISPDDTQEIDSTIEAVFSDLESEEFAIILMCNKCGCRMLLDLNTSFSEMN